MERKINFAVGEYYHVYNRGVEKRDIFLDNDDRDRFQKILYVSNSSNPVVFKTIQRLPLDKIDIGEKRVAIGAYVLMPNHFHILVKEITEGGLTNFMAKLTTSYSKYFNKKHERVGPLFQSRFKAEHVDDDNYLQYLYAYIHLNPVKLIEPAWKEDGIHNRERAEKYLKDYRYSSYLDYSEDGANREEQLILSKTEFPEYFGEPREFKQYLRDWLEYEMLEKTTLQRPPLEPTDLDITT